jgi:Na+/H+ antiporter NhaD/arsenite permease-like protein
MKLIKHFLFFTFFVISIFSVGVVHAGSSENGATEIIGSTLKTDTLNQEIVTDQALEHTTDHVSDHAKPAGWSVIPFILLLLMIATGPLFYEHFWHKNYPKIAVFLAIIVVLYYLFVLHNTHQPVHALAEYVQFISLLTGLFFASGAIMINIDKKATPMANVIILLVGAVIANVIGTTGASMLLIRPFIRLNKGRIRAYHIVFFIFVVSNVGGSLTPIGDPPLFLGFLKGIPFFWTLTNNFLPWVLGVSLLCLMFYFFDSRNKKVNEEEVRENFSNKVSLIGAKNFLWLGIIVLAVFIDPNVFEWVPGIMYHGQKISFIREIIMLTAAFLSYRLADKKILKENEFDIEPIREVAFLFVGIFGTMMPALELVSIFARSDAGQAILTHNVLYWGTGSLSGFLDNAPTYLNFLAAGMSARGADINVVSEVVQYAQGGVYYNSVIDLKAISIGAVFFGAFSYIGNGPNFMVKSIAEQIGIDMPSFFGYIVKYSIPILVPVLIITWLIFFYSVPV